MKPFQGGLRLAFLCYFMSHIPITICIDGQAALSRYYPEFLLDLVGWYCDIFGDILMRGDPSYDIWFSSIVTCELLFQLPFFFVAVHILRQFPNNTSDPAKEYPEWFRMACIIYGSHVSTTLIPILTSFWASSKMTIGQKIATTLVYSPYLFFPLFLLCHAVAQDFGDVNKKKKKNS